MRTYNYIILDWDGNLAKTLDIWLDAIRVVTQRRGLHFTDHQIAGFFGDFRGLMLKAGVDDPQAAFIEAETIAKQTLPTVELYPGAAALLRYLRRTGKHTALITSSTRNQVMPLLRKHDFLNFFDEIVTADDITHHKPHPEPLVKALEKLGGSKDEAVIVGDSDKDLGAALNFGIDSILYHEQSHEKFYSLSELEQLRPNYVVKRLLDIKKIII